MNEGQKIINDQQKEIERVMNFEAAKKLKAPVFKTEYGQIFFDEVNRRQQELTALAVQLSHPSVDLFINNSLNKVASSLRAIAETGRAVLKQKKADTPVEAKTKIDNSDAISIANLAANLKSGLAQIAEDTTKFNKIKGAENDFDEAIATEKVLEAQAEDPVNVKKMTIDRLLEARGKLLHPELRTIFTNQYYDELNEKVNTRLLEAYASLKELQLQHNPVAYYEMVEADLMRRLQGTLQDPDLINQLLENFRKEADSLGSSLLTNDQEQRVNAANSLDKLVETFLQKIPVDKVTVEAQGRIFECRFEPKISASEYGEKFQEAQATVETYLKCLDVKKLNLSEWNETFTFVNGTLKARLDYRGPNEKDKERGLFYEFVVIPDHIEFKHSSQLGEEKMAKMKQFKAAFEAWEKTPVSELGFTYGDPPIYIDMAKYLGMEGKDKDADKEIDKEDIAFDFFFQENVTEFIELAKYKKDGAFVFSEDRYYIFDNEEGKKYLKTQKTYQHYAVEPDTLTIETWEYYKPSEVMDKVVMKKRIIQDNDKIDIKDFNTEGKIIRKEVSLPGFPHIRTIYYSNGKSIENENGKYRPEIKAILEWEENGEKKTLYSYAELKENSPDFTEDEYLDYMAQNLTTDALKNAWLKLMYSYTFDSPDEKYPLKKGSKTSHKDYPQSPQETVRRTEHGLALGDCEDAAFLCKEILRRQGRDAYVLLIPHHADTISLYKTADDSYYIKSYGIDGVSINSKSLVDYDPNEKYPTVDGALKSYQNFRKKLGLPIRFIGFSTYGTNQHDARDFINILERIKTEDDPWPKTSDMSKFIDERGGIWWENHVLYLPQDLIKAANIESGNDHVRAFKGIFLHSKDAYYALNVLPSWLKVNQDKN